MIMGLAVRKIQYCKALLLVAYLKIGSEFAIDLLLSFGARRPYRGRFSHSVSPAY